MYANLILKRWRGSSCRTFGRRSLLAQFAKLIVLALTILGSASIGLASPRVYSAEDAALAYVEQATTDEALSYISRAFFEPGSFDSHERLIAPELVLGWIARSPGLLPRHLPRAFQLFGFHLKTHIRTPEERAKALRDFVKSFVVNLKDDEPSRAIAEELNHQVGERFDRAFRSWLSLSPVERGQLSFLLGYTAVASAEPEFFVRLSRFVQTASISEFGSFVTALRTQSAGGRVPLLPEAQQVENRFVGFFDAFVASHPFLARAIQAHKALMRIENQRLDDEPIKRDQFEKLSADFETVLVLGSEPFVAHALRAIELQMPNASEVATKNYDLKFADFVLAPQIEMALEKAEQRWPALKARISTLREHLFELGKSHLAQKAFEMNKERADAARQLADLVNRNRIHTAKMRELTKSAFTPNTCSSLFK